MYSDHDETFALKGPKIARVESSDCDTERKVSKAIGFDRISALRVITVLSIVSTGSPAKMCEIDGRKPIEPESIFGRSTA
jgi:hypothetical protein